jgi:hypothetical protein
MECSHRSNQRCEKIRTKRMYKTKTANQVSVIPKPAAISMVRSSQPGARTSIEGLTEGLDGRGDDGLTTAVDPLEGAEVERALQLRSFGGKILGKLRDEEVGGKRHRHFL